MALAPSANAFASANDQYLRLFEPLRALKGVVGWCALDHSGTCLHSGGVMSAALKVGQREAQFVAGAPVRFTVGGIAFAVVRSTHSDHYAVSRGGAPTEQKCLAVARVAFGRLVFYCQCVCVRACVQERDGSGRYFFVGLPVAHVLACHCVSWCNIPLAFRHGWMCNWWSECRIPARLQTITEPLHRFCTQFR